MQIIRTILKISNGVATVCDEWGNPVAAPEIVVGMSAIVELDLRSAGVADDEDAKLLPYPFDELESARGFYLALDSDYLQETDPKLLRNSGITLYRSEDGRTLFRAELPDTAVPSLVEALKNQPTVSMIAEFAGYAAGESEVHAEFVWSFSLNIRNRVYLGGNLESVRNDPQYLKTEEVIAFIAAEVAKIEVPPGERGPQGEAGPAPLFQFSATGGDPAEEWHDEWEFGDVYMHISRDGGETWGNAIRFGSGDINPMPPITEYDPENSYGAYELVAFGNPRCTYQAKKSVNPWETPSANPEKWLLVAAGFPGKDGEQGKDGRSSHWYNGRGVPDAAIGAELDYYLDNLTFNYYVKTANGTWQMQGCLKGLDASGITFRGSFDAIASYSPKDAVEYLGSVWYCTYPATGKKPPVLPETSNTWWTLYVEKGAKGDGGSVRIVQINMLDPKSSPTINEMSNSTPEERLYILGIPRGSTGATGTVQIKSVTALDPDATPQIYELPGSTAYNRIYQIALPRGQQGIQGIQGEGLHIDQSGTLAQRYKYDTAPRGFTYCATELLQDENGFFYQRLYQRTSEISGEWSEAIRLYLGKPGERGEQGEPGIGIQGPPGENAAVVPDLEFLGGRSEEAPETPYVFGGQLTIDGIRQVAQVELYNEAGRGVVQLIGTDGVRIETDYELGQTVFQFGQLDVSRGGRIRFAQGIGGATQYQEYLQMGGTLTYPEWVLAVQNTMEEAPKDGNFYCRRNGKWVAVAVQALDAVTLSGTQEYNRALTAGSPWSLTFDVVASNGADVEIALTSGTLPAGLALDGKTLSGTPAAAGSAELVFTASTTGAAMEIRVTLTVTAALVMYYGWIEATEQMYRIADLTADVLTKATVQSATAAAMGKTSLGDNPAGALVFVLLPQAAGLKASKFDGIGGYLEFETDNGDPGTGANGTELVLDGTAYLAYGEYSLIDGETFVKVEEL